MSMDSSHFVLSVAVFMVVATVMLTIPLILPGPSSSAGYPAMTCRFDRYCAGGTCSAPLPADFRIIPEGEFGRSYLDMEGRPARLSVLRDEAWVEYSSFGEDVGMMKINLLQTGAFSLQLQRGDASGEIVETGEGRCGRPVTEGAS